MTSHAREALMDAALRLAAAGKLEHASVADLAREAGVARRTFYRQFDSVEETLLAALRRDGASFASGLSAEQASPPSAYLESVFRHWENNIALLQALTKEGHAQAGLVAWMEAAGETMHRTPLSSLDSAAPARYLACFMTGGVAAALILWAADEARPTPTCMAKTLMVALGRA